MTTTDAAHAVVHDYPGGSESLGPRVGISAAVLRNKVNPNNETHHLTLNEARRITAITGDHRILQAWAHEEGFLMVKAPDDVRIESDMSVFEQYAGLGIANGAFSQAIYIALSDGGVTSEEMREIEEAGRAFMTKIAEVKQRLRGMVG